LPFKSQKPIAVALFLPDDQFNYKNTIPVAVPFFHLEFEVTRVLDYHLIELNNPVKYFVS
jgi:hypothetical protein